MPQGGQRLERAVRAEDGKREDAEDERTGPEPSPPRSFCDGALEAFEALHLTQRVVDDDVLEVPRRALDGDHREVVDLLCGQPSRQGEQPASELRRTKHHDLGFLLAESDLLRPGDDAGSRRDSGRRLPDQA